MRKMIGSHRETTTVAHYDCVGLGVNFRRPRLYIKFLISNYSNV